MTGQPREETQELALRLQHVPAEVREELIDLLKTIDGWLIDQEHRRVRSHFDVHAYTLTPGERS